MKKLLVILPIVLVMGWLGFMLVTNSGSVVARECASSHGIWLAEHKECDFGLVQSAEQEVWCQARGGAYENCASPCRYATDNQAACIAACANVCRF